MTRALVSGVRAVRRREQRRPDLGWKGNALVGAVLGVAVPLGFIIKDYREGADSFRPREGMLRYYGEPLAFGAGIGAITSQKGWRGLILSSVGSAALSAPIGGRTPDPFSQEDWHDTAMFGALAGPILVRPIVRFVARVI